MKRTIASFVVIAATAAFLSQLEGEEKTKTANADVERGRYLVHDVAQCVQCHSPRDEAGNIVERRALRGAPIPVRSPYPQVDWAFQAPQIAGLPGWEPEDVVFLLQNGHRPDSRVPLPPMPKFRMNEADARAVVAYLTSLQ